MRWFKHDTDANQDAKLQNVLLDYGLEGYGLYWYCIEQIAGKVDKENFTFELEHDARIIAKSTGSTPQKVEEMMRYFVKIGLFENSSGIITCLKLAKRLDKSMTSNKEMREIIENLRKNSHDGVMIGSCHSHDGVMQEETRSEIDKEKKNNVSDKSPTTKKFKYSAGQLKMAKMMFDKIREIMPREPEPNFESWANDIRLAVASLGVTNNDFWQLFLKANAHHFWATNIRSPKKLRAQYPKLEVELNEATQQARSASRASSSQPPLTAGERLRIQLNEERRARGEPPIDD